MRVLATIIVIQLILALDHLNYLFLRKLQRFSKLLIFDTAFASMERIDPCVFISFQQL